MSIQPFLSLARRGRAPVFNVKDYGATGDGTTDDRTAVQAAINAATAESGGTVYLPSGTYRLATAITLTDGVRLVGSGRGPNGAVLDLDAGASITLASASGLDNLRVEINDATTVDAIQADGAGKDASAGVIQAGAFLTNVEVSGGNNASAYAVAFRNTFRCSMRDVDIRTGLNGVLFTNDDNLFNYGNAQFDRVEISLSASGRVGFDFDGTKVTKFVNLVETGYLSCVTGVGTGSTGVRIRNAPYLSFGQLDLEGCATSLSIEGGLSGGSAARGVTIKNIYADGAITIGDAAEGLVFAGGKITGTISGNGASKAYYGGTVDASNLRLTTMHASLHTGPRFSVAPITREMRNQTGATIVAGSVLRQHNTIEDGVRGLTGATVAEWIVIAAEEVAAAANGVFAFAGTSDVRVTNTTNLGDYVVVDDGAGNEGQAKSVGTTYPATPGILVGICIKSGTAGGTARVLIRRA